ncbi:GNAT family N-acetyltransferase [Aestuariivivens sp. NBU2969]|uniref:GNAT family N-acetyltransferase n=1 Tax=Aestuariivivens sp. NBU2969 TaxID=2873267 RepID=UPI001CBB8AD5|nr:GNAT family N-acetyltransferase [Aestuariivivens sp. NBU2969]
MIQAETERLLLSKVTLKDASFFVELMNTPGFLKYVGDRHIKSPKDAREHIKNRFLKSYNKYGFGYYKLTLREQPNIPIGVVGILKRDVMEHPDLGFALLPQYERQGYGYEASVEMLKWAKEKFKIRRILAITDPDNDKSIKLLEKLGLTFEKRMNPFDETKELLLFAKDL